MHWPRGGPLRSKPRGKGADARSGDRGRLVRARRSERSLRGSATSSSRRAPTSRTTTAAVRSVRARSMVGQHGAWSDQERRVPLLRFGAADPLSGISTRSGGRVQPATGRRHEDPRLRAGSVPMVDRSARASIRRSSQRRWTRTNEARGADRVSGRVLVVGTGTEDDLVPAGQVGAVLVADPCRRFGSWTRGRRQLAGPARGRALEHLHRGAGRRPPPSSVRSLISDDGRPIRTEAVLRAASRSLRRRRRASRRSAVSPRSGGRASRPTGLTDPVRGSMPACRTRSLARHPLTGTAGSGQHLGRVDVPRRARRLRLEAAADDRRADDRSPGRRRISLGRAGQLGGLPDRGRAGAGLARREVEDGGVEAARVHRRGLFGRSDRLDPWLGPRGGRLVARQGSQARHEGAGGFVLLREGDWPRC